MLTEPHESTDNSLTMSKLSISTANTTTPTTVPVSTTTSSSIKNNNNINNNVPPNLIPKRTVSAQQQQQQQKLNSNNSTPSTTPISAAVPVIPVILTTTGQVVGTYPVLAKQSTIVNNSNISQSNMNMSSDYDSQLVQLLCDHEQGFDLLIDRIKQDVHSSKDAAAFLKKRAMIEEEYARSMMRLGQSYLTQNMEGKDGSYGEAWIKFCQMHERIGQLRLQFSGSIVEISDEVLNVSRNAERSRKQLKEAGNKQLKVVQEAETFLEKTKLKYEWTSEEWEKTILQLDQDNINGLATSGVAGNTGSSSIPSSNGSEASGHPSAVAASLKKGPAGIQKSISMSLFRSNNSGSSASKLVRAEEDARAKAAQANEIYKGQLIKTNSLRQHYFQQYLPQLIRSLKDTNDECDHKLKAFLLKYSQEFENALVSEATTVCPLEKSDIVGLNTVLEAIKPEKDFDDFMMAYFNTKGKQFSKDMIAYTPYSMSEEAFAIIHPKPVFGVDLATVIQRDGGLIPPILVKCIQSIEEPPIHVSSNSNGTLPGLSSAPVHKSLSTPGLYRISGLNASIQKLRQLFDKDLSKTNIFEVTSDVHVIASLLKLYFRELPDPLLPRSFFYRFIEASRIEDENMALIKTHELVNELPDANYATLRELMAHLWKVQKHEKENKMGAQNLAIVWGPSLMDPPQAGSPQSPGNPSSHPSSVGDLKSQSKVIEIIIKNFEKIFDL